MKYLFCILLISSCCISCTSHTNVDRLKLDSTNSFLSFKIDEQTRPPKFCLWTFKDSGKEYLSFPNHGDEILIYDLRTQLFVKKIHYQPEGPNGVGMIHNFYPIDFNNIYIANTMIPEIYLTDSTGSVKDKFILSEAINGESVVPPFLDVITYRPMYVLHDSLYFSQTLNPLLGKEYWKYSPVGIIFDQNKNKITPTPLVHHRSNYKKWFYQPASLGGGKVSGVFNGDSFVYSFNLQDSVYRLSRNFKTITRYLAKSRYIKELKGASFPSDINLNMLLKCKCELPSYGNLIYDSYREVYYRFVFPATEMEKERSYMDIYHSGRKLFSIMILDKDLNVVGETLFPEYTYNSNLLFIREDGLYLCVSHFKRADYDENVLRFQKIKLVKI